MLESISKKVTAETARVWYEAALLMLQQHLTFQYRLSEVTVLKPCQLLGNDLSIFSLCITSTTLLKLMLG